MIEHKNIVVTGASSGIGKSILEELLQQEGNRILAAARRADRITGYGENVIPFFLRSEHPGGNRRPVCKSRGGF